MRMYWKIYGGEADGTEAEIDMNPCSDFNWYKPSNHESMDRIARAHMQVDQFFCPSIFDMSFFGSAEDVVRKKLYVDVSYNPTNDADREYLENMYIAMLINTHELQWNEDYEEAKIHNFTSLMWMPISINQQT